MNKTEMTYKTKAIKVVLSCMTKEQLVSASRYVDLYYMKFKDLNFHSYLINLIKNKISNVK